MERASEIALTAGLLVKQTKPAVVRCLQAKICEHRSRTSLDGPMFCPIDDIFVCRCSRREKDKRKREREGERDRQRERQTERERACLCVCVSVCLCVCVPPPPLSHTHTLPLEKRLKQTTKVYVHKATRTKDWRQKTPKVSAGNDHARLSLPVTANGRLSVFLYTFSGNACHKNQSATPTML